MRWPCSPSRSGRVGESMLEDDDDGVGRVVDIVRGGKEKWREERKRKMREVTSGRVRSAG